MNKFKIIISLALIIAIAFSIAVIPSCASAEQVGIAVFTWLLEYGGGKVLDYLGPKVSEVLGIGQEASDHFHNWERYGSGGIGSDGTRVANFRCTICGQTITADPDTIRTAYNSYVYELPATGYDSEGGLLIELTHDNSYFNYNSDSSNYGFHCGHRTGAYPSYPLSSTSNYNGGFNCDPLSPSLVLYPKSGSSEFRLNRVYFSFSVLAPVSGFYKLAVPSAFSGSMIYSGVSYPIYGSQSLPSSGIGTYFDTGATVLSSFDVLVWRYVPFSGGTGVSLSYFYLTASAPKFRVIPADSMGSQINLTYAPDTRVTNITGDVAYYDINGNLQFAPSVNIVNEGAKTFYNPVTNTTQEINNWSYDYSDRSYTLTLDTGDTTTVTYGDEYIRIQEGDTVYNVYYVTNNTTPPLTHTHDWSQTGATQPTCTEYGQKVYTCFTCGEAKTDILPALGHDWVQSGSFDAVYDDDGELVEDAYVLYVCSRCGEEYKDYDGVGPPAPPEPPPDEDDSSGILAWLKQFKIWLGEKLDAITGGGDTNITNDYNITYVDEDGEEQDINVKSIADKFAWWKQVADIGQTFVSQVAASESAAYAYAADGARAGPTGAPSIPLDLSRAQSYYGVDYGGEIEMLDLSWYTPYKKTVDDLVSGFLWLFFLWSLFKRAPAIIAGEGLIESRLSELRSSGSASYSSPDVPLLPSKRKGG